MLNRKLTVTVTIDEVKKLVEEARNQLMAHAAKIAEGLCASAQQGHPTSARLLLELAGSETDSDVESDKRPLRSLALRLAALPLLPPESAGEPPALNALDPTKH